MINSQPNSSNESNKVIKDMSGYIAKNDKRNKDTQPHWRGKVRIAGKDYLLSLWERDDKIMNVSVTDPELMPARPTTNTSTPPPSIRSGSTGLGTDASSTDIFGDIFGSLPGG